MKKLFAFAFAAMMLAGCVKSPLVGGIYTDVKDGLAVTGNAGSSKVGTAEAKGYVLSLIHISEPTRPESSPWAMRASRLRPAKPVSRASTT